MNLPTLQLTPVRQASDHEFPDGETSSAQLKRKFDELEHHIAEVRELALQSFQGPSAFQSVGLGDFDDLVGHDRGGHESWADLLDFDVVSAERPLFLSQLETNQSPQGRIGTPWHKGVERSATRPRPLRIVPQPSVYDIDLLELHQGVRQKLLRQSRTPEAPQQSLDTLVQKMLYLLASDRYWGGKRLFWFETLAFEKLAPVTRYQIIPTVEHYQAIQPEFQPTQLQLTRFHWPMVDWIPFPGLRDKIILHAHELDLTAVVEATIDSWCLESKIAMPSDGGHHESKVYYRLTDYIAYRQQQAASNTPISSRMSKSVETEFVLALRLPTQTFKLEQSYFDHFPMLYTEDAVAKGQYRPIILQSPSPELESISSPRVGDSRNS